MIKKKLQAFLALLNSVKHFFCEDLWDKDMAALPALRRMLFAFCRIVMIVIKGFTQDKCSLQASALTYITLVSMVPMLAIMFSFSKGMGMQDRLLDTVGLQRIIQVDETTGKPICEYKVISPEVPSDSNAADNKDNSVQRDPKEAPSPKKSPAVSLTSSATDLAAQGGLAQKLPKPMQEALIKIFLYVENTNFAALGLIGSVMLLFSVIFSMAKLENCFNTIWCVKTARPFLRKCSEYLVVLILIPVIFLVATSLNTILLSNKVVAYLQVNYGQIVSLLQFLVNSIGILLLVAGFSFFYMFMPNTKVRVFPAMISGVVTGILWFGVQMAYLNMQIGLTKFNSIYGTFAVVPFFLAWLYANWSIILFGAELSFALQNHSSIHLQKTMESDSTGMYVALGQLILFETCKAFIDGTGAWSPSDFGKQRGIPFRLLRHVVDILAEAKLIIKVANEKQTSDCYLPGKDIASLSPADVEEAFRHNQAQDTKAYINGLPEVLRNKFISSYTSFYKDLSAMTYDILLRKTNQI